MPSTRRNVSVVLLAASLVACQGEGPTDAPIGPPGELIELGRGDVAERFTGELCVHGNTAYTTTWSTRTLDGVQSRGNAIKIWSVSALEPVLVDSLIVADATTIGDVQVTPDGRYLVAATERVPGSIVIYSITNPRKPARITQFYHPAIEPGVHTAEVQSMNGKVYAFMSIDPSTTQRARLVIADITIPATPVVVMSREMGDPLMHDVFVRDGILMTALWNDGLVIWDIGGGGKGGTVANPVKIGEVKTKGGKVHNAYWYHDPSNGSKRYVFVGEEGPGSAPSSAAGDLHVIDVSDMAKPQEVAFHTVAGAGVHNFTVDAERGILYAAWYNGGVRALNIRGDLGACASTEKDSDGRCDLGKMGRELAKGPVSLDVPVYVWGVHLSSGRLYASDMWSGLWRLSVVPES